MVVEREASDYRPHLDGLRAIAVYLVVGFHAGVGRMAGGFIGVDVFFVLSGFLVTGVLLRDLEGPPGRVRLGRFYARRARRLLPAAAVNLVVTAVVFASIGSVLRMAEAKEAIRSAALYFANWHFIGQSADYFADDVESSPVLHYWSLSVEEQFYVVWPLVLGGLFVLTRTAGRQRRNALRATVALLAAASMFYALGQADTALHRSYYGTDTRAYQLLAGALLALTPGLAVRLGRSPLRRVLPLSSLVGIAGLVILTTRLSRFDPIERGVLTTIITCGLLVSLEASTGGIARWALSRPWVTYLGKVSYGTYLWHWLVVVVLTHEVEVSPVTTAMVTAVVATGIASLSYQLLEQPIRTAPQLDRWRLASIGTGLAASLLVGLAIAPAVIDASESVSVAASASQEVAGGGVPPPAAAVLADAQFDIYQWGDCEFSGGGLCTIHGGKGPRALIVGDSHAATWTPMLTQIAERHDLDLRAVFLGSCPWVHRMKYPYAGPTCFAEQDDLYADLLPEFDPDIVFLSHRPVDDPINGMRMTDAEEGPLDPAEPVGAEVLRRRMTDLVEDLRRQGRTVVLFEPLPVPPVDLKTPECLSLASTVDACRFVATASAGGQATTMRELAERDDRVVTVDSDHLVCPYFPICDPVVDGAVVWRDENHLTITFTEALTDPIEQVLVEAGVLGER